MIPRFLHKWYAKAIGYYWAPCPKCGKMTGGHEKHGEVVWNDERTTGYRCCWECRDEENEKIKCKVCNRNLSFVEKHNAWRCFYCHPSSMKQCLELSDFCYDNCVSFAICNHGDKEVKEVKYE